MAASAPTSAHHRDPAVTAAGKPAFIMDYSLNRVAKQLRLLGLDAVCDATLTPAVLLERAEGEGRILLTGSRRLMPMVLRRNREVARAAAAAGRGDAAGDDSDGDDGGAGGWGTAADDEAAMGVPPHNVTPGASIGAKGAAPPPAAWARRGPEYKTPGKVIVGYDSDGNSQYEDDDAAVGETEAPAAAAAASAGAGDAEAAADLLSLSAHASGEDDDDDDSTEGGEEDECTSEDANVDGAGGDGGSRRRRSRRGSHRRRAATAANAALHFPGGAGAAAAGAGPAVRYIHVTSHQRFKDQMKAVLSASGVAWDPATIFTRCVTCNVGIVNVPVKSAVQGRVNPNVYAIYARFYECPKCRKVFWGMDEGVVVNYKASRTIDHLRQYCSFTHGNALRLGHGDDGGDAYHPGAGALRRHLLSFPRVVKCAILRFLSPAELGDVAAAFPMLAELVDVVARGGDEKFRRAAPRRRKAAAVAAAAAAVR